MKKRNRRVVQALDNLEATVREYCNKNTVSFSVFINCEGREVTITERTADMLETGGISMRNLSGAFIK